MCMVCGVWRVCVCNCKCVSVCVDMASQTSVEEGTMGKSLKAGAILCAVKFSPYRKHGIFCGVLVLPSSLGKDNIMCSTPIHSRVTVSAVWPVSQCGSHAYP